MVYYDRNIRCFLLSSVISSRIWRVESSSWTEYNYDSHSLIIRIACAAPPCKDGELRLFGGQVNTEGTIEVCQSGVWNGATICDDLWDTNEAAVVCRQLGFQSDGKLYTSKFGVEI